jgi:hypothetical protein
MVNVAPTQASPTSDETIYFLANFSRAVTGFQTSYAIIGGTTGATGVTILSLDDGHDWLIGVYGMKQSGWVSVSLSAGAAKDVVTNLASLASKSSINVVDYGNVTIGINTI